MAPIFFFRSSPFLIIFSQFKLAAGSTIAETGSFRSPCPQSGQETVVEIVFGSNEISIDHCNTNIHVDGCVVYGSQSVELHARIIVSPEQAPSLNLLLSRAFILLCPILTLFLYLLMPVSLSLIFHWYHQVLSVFHLQKLTQLLPTALNFTLTFCTRSSLAS